MKPLLTVMRGDENVAWKVGDIILGRKRRSDIVVSVIRRPASMYPRTVALVRQMSWWEELKTAWQGRMPLE